MGHYDVNNIAESIFATLMIKKVGPISIFSVYANVKLNLFIREKLLFKINILLIFDDNKMLYK